MGSFAIQNKQTLKIVKDAVSSKPFKFASEEDARHFANGMERDSVLNATAFNSVRPSKYQVITI